MNSGWDDSTAFIVPVVLEDENLLDPVKVTSDPMLLAKNLEHCFIYVNGHHRDKARKLLLAERFNKFPLPKKGKCMVCTCISKWAIEQFDILFPKLKQVEKKVKLFFETEVGEKTIN